MRKLLGLFLCFSLLFCGQTYGEDRKSDVKVVKMEDIKQELTGLNKEYNQGDLVKVKISPLPKTANTITAVYKLSLLENSKKSDNCEALTKVEKSTDEKRDGSDFVFAARGSPNNRYQILFAATYIEHKPGTNEIVNVYNPDIAVYDVKINGNNPGPQPDVDPNIIPDGPNGFIKLVYNESMKLKTDKIKSKTLFTNLANSFSGMSSKIAAGIYKDSTDDAEQADRVNRFLTESKELNNKAITDSGVDKILFDGTFDVAIKGKLDELFNAGKLRKFNEYQSIWAEIAEGYRLAAKQ